MYPEVLLSYPQQFDRDARDTVWVESINELLSFLFTVELAFNIRTAVNYELHIIERDIELLLKSSQMVINRNSCQNSLCPIDLLINRDRDSHYYPKLKDIQIGLNPDRRNSSTRQQLPNT